MRSMTGFGTGEAPFGSGKLSVEVRGVNHRFLDVRVRVPREMNELAPYVEAHAPGWDPPSLEPGEDTEPDALTMIVDADETEGEQEGDPWEEGVAENGAEPEPEPELAERSGLFRRRRR